MEGVIYLGVNLGAARGTIDLDANGFFDSIKAAISSLSNLSGAAQDTSNEVEDLQEVVNGAGAELDNVFDQAVDNAKNSVEDLGDALPSVGKDIEVHLNETIEDTKDDVVDLGESISEAIPVIDDFSKKFSKVGEKCKGVGDNLSKYVTVPLAAIGTYAIKSASDLESAANKVSAYFGDVGTEAEKNGQLVSQVFGTNVTDDFDTVANSIIMVRRNLSDLSNSEMVSITSKAIVLDEKFGIDMSETLRGVNSLMNNFGLTADEALDFIVTGTQNGLDKTDELGDNITEYAGKFAQAGYSASEYFQLLNNGLEGGAYNLDKTNDAINEVTTRLADGTIGDAIGGYSEKTQSLFKDWQDGEATQKQVIDSIVEDINNCKNQQEALNLAATAFGTMAEDGNLKFITSLTTVGDTYNDVTGAAQKMQDTAISGTASDIASLKNDIKDLATKIGEDLVPVLQEIVTEVEKVTNKFKDLDPETRKAIVDFGLFFAIIGPIISGIGKFASGIGSVVKSLKGLKTAFQGITGASWFTKLSSSLKSLPSLATSAFTKLGSAISSGISALSAPVTLGLGTILAGVVAFIAGYGIGTLIYNALGDEIDEVLFPIFDKIVAVWNEIVAFFTESIPAAWDSFITFIEEKAQIVSEFFQSIWETISGFFIGVWESIVETFTGIAEWIDENIIQPVLAIVVPIVEKIGEIIAKIWEIITTLFGVAASWVKEHVIDPIVQKVSDMVTSIVEFFQSLWNKIVSIFSAIGEWWQENVADPVSDVIATLVDAIVEFFTSAYKGIKKVFGKIGDWFGDRWDDIKGAFSSVASWFSTIFTNAYTGIKKVFGGIKDWFKELWDDIKEVFSGAATAVSETFESAFKTVFNGAMSTVENIVNFFVDSINDVVDVINDIPGVSISKLDRLSLPRLAVGLDYVPYDGYVAMLHKGERVMTKQENEESRNGRSNGGDVFIFNSPEPINEIEAARQMKKTKQELAEGF